MGNDAKNPDGVAKIRDLIGGMDFAMLTTVCPDGMLHSRPMATQKMDFDGHLWFFTRYSAHKVHELTGNYHVSVEYASPGDRTWVALSGVANVSRSKKKMEKLWTPELKAYFPDGLDDTDLALIEVDVMRGEYWEGPGMLAYAVELATALATGERIDLGENEKVTL